MFKKGEFCPFLLGNCYDLIDFPPPMCGRMRVRNGVNTIKGDKYGKRKSDRRQQK